MRDRTWLVTIGTVQVLVKGATKHAAGVAACQRLRVTVAPDEVRVREATPRDLDRWTAIEAAMREPGIMRLRDDHEQMRL